MSSIQIPETGIQRTARLISDRLHPKTWIVAVCLMIGWKADHLQGVMWSLVGVLFAAVIPMLFIDHGIKRGRWGDRNVGARKARLLVMIVILLSVLTCFTLMTTLDARRVLSALIASMLVTLAALALVTLAWKISVHQAVSAGAVIMLAQTYDPWALLGYVLVAVVGWSRIELRDHTPAQVIAGTLLGTAVAAATFAALR
ncbi:phosphatase PAP2 family protein [Streptomyces sp. CoH27]|uniref:phosphatase PAP2 family protein n=1 Tax=Streptomyces sp. CoH27 TaxID=2875763 RepID=UPI001CD7B0EC|nr:phosphatase PAP2 family protein [Streptomyces sp. CoH27]